MSLDDIPVYAKGGAIIPKLDPSVETLWIFGDPDVIDHNDMADQLWVDLFPYGASSFKMVDETTFSMDQHSDGFDLTISDAPFERTYSLRAVLNTYDNSVPINVLGPSGMLVGVTSYALWDSGPPGWYYDDKTSELWIRDSCRNCVFHIMN